MNNSDSLDAIHVTDISLWSHVGVLDQERLLGQKFLLDFFLWIDMSTVVVNDNIASTADYSSAFSCIQQLSLDL